MDGAPHRNRACAGAAVRAQLAFPYRTRRAESIQSTYNGYAIFDQHRLTVMEVTMKYVSRIVFSLILLIGGVIIGLEASSYRVSAQDSASCDRYYQNAVDAEQRTHAYSEYSNGYALLYLACSDHRRVLAGK